MTVGRVLHGSPAPVRTVAPTDAPVTLAEAKAHCRVDHTDDDTLIQGLIDAATDHIDGYTGTLGRAVMTQTWRQDFACFSDLMRLPLRPVQYYESIAFFDAENGEQSADSDIYGLYSDALGPYMALLPGMTPPATYSRRDAVSVTFVCGADEAPAAIKQAVLLMVGHWYENREAVAAGDMRELPMAVDALLRPYRVVGV